VEKTVNVHVFEQVYKPRNINVLFSQCVHNGMAVHLTRSKCEEFKKSCIPSAMDGTGDMLWDGSEEDGNVRSV
jgi:hypothetical protein